MNSFNRLEVYIPLEAEVKNIPLWSLPSKVLRKMDLPPTDFKGSKKLSSSPEGIWISPAVIRRKGQKQASPIGKDLMEKASSLPTASGPLRMSFVSSNRAAYKVLKEIPGTNFVPLPQGPAPRIYQTAVVIYRGRIYLSLRKNNLSLSDGSSPPTTSSSSSSSLSSLKSQKKELQNENRPKKKHTLYKENQKEDAHEVRDMSSSMFTRPVLQSTRGEPSVRGQQATQEAAAALSPVWFEPVGGSSEGGECELHDLDGEDAETDSAERTHTGSQSSVRTELLSAARGSTSLVKECDFDDLAQEERITQMKARLRQKEAALSSLKSAV